VAGALDVNPSNASRTCDRLMKAGLLDRRESPDDRRNVTLTLTEAGTWLVDKVTHTGASRSSVFCARCQHPSGSG
jgi:DNA-binding MarR family transcriptional regulator